MEIYLALYSKDLNDLSYFHLSHYRHIRVYEMTVKLLGERERERERKRERETERL